MSVKFATGPIPFLFSLAPEEPYFLQNSNCIKCFVHTQIFPKGYVKNNPYKVINERARKTTTNSITEDAAC